MQQVEAVRTTLDIDASLKMPAVVAAANEMLFASADNPSGTQPGSLTEQVAKLVQHLGITLSADEKVSAEVSSC